MVLENDHDDILSDRCIIYSFILRHFRLEPLSIFTNCFLIIEIGYNVLASMLDETLTVKATIINISD